MFQETSLIQGLGAVLKKIDYSQIANSNIYYQKALNSGEMVLPKFFRDVDRKKISKAIKRKSLARLKPGEKHALLLNEMLLSKDGIARDMLLANAARLTRAYIKDTELQLIIAKTLIRNHMYEDAMRALYRCVHQEPKKTEPWCLMSLIASLANDHGTAIHHARTALQLGAHFYHILPRVFVFAQLAMGVPSVAGPYDTRGLVDDFKTSPDALQKIPKVYYIEAPQKLKKQPIIFFACDPAYFEKFGKNLLLSLREITSSFTVHIHFIGLDQENVKWLQTFKDEFDLSLVISYEDCSDTEVLSSNCYLASCRFLHAAVFLKRFNRPYLMLDADSLLNRGDLLKDFTANRKRPVLHYSEHAAIWDTISAPFTFFPANKIAFDFLERCSNYLAHMFFTEEKYFWYIDQLALFGAFLLDSEQIELCPAQHASDIHCGDEAMFWTLSNDKDVSKFNTRVKKLQQDYADLILSQPDMVA